MATLTLAAAVVMAVVDATRSVAAAQLILTPMLASWQSVSPSGPAALQTFMETNAVGFLSGPRRTFGSSGSQLRHTGSTGIPALSYCKVCVGKKHALRVTFCLLGRIERE